MIVNVAQNGGRRVVLPYHGRNLVHRPVIPLAYIKTHTRVAVIGKHTVAGYLGMHVGCKLVISIAHGACVKVEDKKRVGVIRRNPVCGIIVIGLAVCVVRLVIVTVKTHFVYDVPCGPGAAAHGPLYHYMVGFTGTAVVVKLYCRAKHRIPRAGGWIPLVCRAANRDGCSGKRDRHVRRAARIVADRDDGIISGHGAAVLKIKPDTPYVAALGNVI